MQDRSAGSSFSLRDGVTALSTCTLRTRAEAWAFAEKNAAAIEAAWQRTRLSYPQYFNGTVYLISDVRIDQGALEASLVRTDFKSHLFWRQQGYPEAGVLDGFGSALIRSSDDHFMLGRQRAGNVNAGLAYAPAGFIDAQDVDQDGFVHIAQSAAREAAEETGLDVTAFVQGEGLHLTKSRAQLSIAVPFRIKMSTAEFLEVAGRHIAESPESELDAIIPVAGLRDIEGVAVAPYMRMLLEALFGEA
jgi:8-oxo-dGTP pyrophosphatase MutT (NUDIX family)